MFLASLFSPRTLQTLNNVFMTIAIALNTSYDDFHRPRLSIV